MGYWFPPLPKDFDPVPRPLLWSGLRAFAVPFPIDAEIFGTDANDKNWYPQGGDVRSDIGSQGALSVAIGGHMPNKPGEHPWFWNQRTAQERLAYYRKLASIQADGDPDSGGLPADSIDYEQKSLTLHYWDLAETPRRKQVTWFADGNHKVQQWNGRAWEPEGYDFNASVDIGQVIGAFGMVTTAAIGYLTASPVIASAWSNVFKATSAPATGGTFDLMAFVGSLVALGQSLPGFGPAMADALVGDGVKQGLMGEVGKMAYKEVATIGKEVSTHLERIRASVEKATEAFPKVDLDAVTKGVVPDDVMTAWHNAQKGLSSFDLYSYEKAAFCYAQSLAKGELEKLLAGHRKAAPDKSTFDVTIGCTLATEKDYEARVLQVSSETFKPALDPFGGDPRAKLNAMVRGLQKRYHLR